MNTTASFDRPADPATVAARIRIAHQRRRDAMIRAYRRALRLAEYRAWLAMEPRTPHSDGTSKSVLQRLVFLGLGLVAGAATVAALITSTPFVLWLLHNTQF